VKRRRIMDDGAVASIDMDPPKKHDARSPIMDPSIGKVGYSSPFSARLVITYRHTLHYSHIILVYYSIYDSTEVVAIQKMIESYESIIDEQHNNSSSYLCKLLRVLPLPKGSGRKPSENRHNIVGYEICYI
jgi:hypothetical protein